ncbi:unnamed protein product [Medioppia subpectinata]|uniref:Uncharacterized protein n=1 Tax=Medioppia subpectinata TaxID=1979941 RepID=A0A7R9KH23_9ACAR|nr:unnamed protein product [Medioppia subpectinata]CAG2103210.1 unnamed protein product [Medioppia subpectinata]
MSNLPKSMTTQELTKNANISFMIETKGCRIEELPLFNDEVMDFYMNTTLIQNSDGMTIRMNWTKSGCKPICYYSPLKWSHELDHQFELTNVRIKWIQN